jgi:hypothetical protein
MVGRTCIPEDLYRINKLSIVILTEIYIPIANQTDMLAREIYAVVPVGGVQEGTLVLFNAWNSRPPPVVQNPARVDQDVAVLGDLRAILEIFDFDIITTLGLVPVGTDDLMLGLYVFVKMIFAGKGVEIVVYLLAAGVYG